MYPLASGHIHTLVLGVSACLVVSRCPSGLVPSMVAISTGARREGRLLMVHVLNREGIIDPDRREVNLSRALRPSPAFVVRLCSSGECSFSCCVQVWSVGGELVSGWCGVLVWGSLVIELELRRGSS